MRELLTYEIERLERDKVRLLYRVKKAEAKLAQAERERNEYRLTVEQGMHHLSPKYRDGFAAGIEAAAECCDVVTMDGEGDLIRERADMIRALSPATPTDTVRQAAIEGWDDLKVAFSVKNDEGVWELPSDTWPEGWELNETDCSGARCVAVFRLDHLPTSNETRAVEAALRDIAARGGDQETLSEEFGEEW